MCYYHSLPFSAIKLNPFMPVATETAWRFWWNLSSKSIVWKIVEGKMLMRTLQSTFLQIFCNIILNSKSIAKSSINPDNIVKRYKWVNLHMCVEPKSALTTLWYLWDQRVFQEIFEGEMLSRYLPTTLLQTFSKLRLNSRVICKINVSPDDICLGDFQAWIGLTC